MVFGVYGTVNKYLLPLSRMTWKQILLIDDKTLADFDMIEGYPDFYDKTEVETTEGKAIMYYLPNDRITDNQGNPAYFKNEESDQITATSKMLTWNL